jgi:hypothetical protein
MSTSTITLPRSAIREKEGVVVLPLKRWRAIEKKHEELRSALQAIAEGEFALQKKKTRSFRDFLKVDLPEHAKDI